MKFCNNNLKHLRRIKMRMFLNPLPAQSKVSTPTRAMSSSQNELMADLRRTMSENNILSEASKIMRSQMTASRPR